MAKLLGFGSVGPGTSGSVQHAERLVATCRRRAALPRVALAGALLIALAVSAALAGLTFSVLAMYMVPVAALLIAFVIHVMAIIAVHFTLCRNPEVIWTALLGAIGLSAVAWLLARARAVLFFEGDEVLGYLAALVEPLAIWVCGLLTSRAHDFWKAASDHLRRAHDLLEAASAAPNSFAVWPKSLQHVYEEIRTALSTPAATRRAMSYRDWLIEHLQEWRRLLALHAPEGAPSPGGPHRPWLPGADGGDDGAPPDAQDSLWLGEVQA